jgi:hypothetical protein
VLRPGPALRDQGRVWYGSGDFQPQEEGAVKNLTENVAQGQASDQANDHAEEARRQWAEPELVELDYESTENAALVVFDGVSYS